MRGILGKAPAEGRLAVLSHPFTRACWKFAVLRLRVSRKVLVVGLPWVSGEELLLGVMAPRLLASVRLSGACTISEALVLLD